MLGNIRQTIGQVLYDLSDPWNLKKMPKLIDTGLRLVAMWKNCEGGEGTRCCEGLVSLSGALLLGEGLREEARAPHAPMCTDTAHRRSGHFRAKRDLRVLLNTFLYSLSLFTINLLDD